MKWKLNEQIHAQKVRVIDEKNEQVGVMSASEALERARSLNLDLIEIAPNAVPPVVKIEEFGKFRYREEKKLRKQKKGAKKSEMKELRFSPFIGQADFDTRIKRINEFLTDKQKVKVVIKFTGRQMAAKNTGYQLMERVLNSAGRDKISIDMEPKFLGRHLVMIISPLSKAKINQDDKDKKDETKDKEVDNKEI